MPDVYRRVAEAPPRILEGLMTALEIRAADPQQQAMLHTYLDDAALPPGARVLEVGCGTGAVTRTLATWPGEACADAFREHFVHDPWLVRRLPALVQAAGMQIHRVRSHGYVETLAAGFMLSSGWIWAPRRSSHRDAAAAELKAEARRRVARGRFFGHIAYLSVVARKSP